MAPIPVGRFALLGHFASASTLQQNVSYIGFVEVRINDGEHDITYDDPFNPQRYAGMSGYRYMSQSDIADMISESGIFTDTRIISSVAAGKSGFFPERGWRWQI